MTKLINITDKVKRILKEPKNQPVKYSFKKKIMTEIASINNPICSNFLNANHLSCSFSYVCLHEKKFVNVEKKPISFIEIGKYN